MPLITLNPSKDTYLREEFPTTNLGSEQWINIMNEVNRTLRIPISFPAHGIDPAWCIRSATLRLYYRAWGGAVDPVGLQVGFYKLVRPNWLEGTGTVAAPAADGATWNRYRPLWDWYSSGGDYWENAPLHSVDVIPAATGVWWEIDVLPIVLDAVYNHESNYPDQQVDILIKFLDETKAFAQRSEASFRSREHALAPELVVDYDDLLATNLTSAVDLRSATLNGEVVDDEGVVVDYVGFVWDTKSLPKPRDIHPAANVNEDLTAFNVVDPNNRFTIAADRVRWDDMPRNESAYVYRECDIDGEFHIWLDARIIAGVDESWAYCLALTNELGDLSTLQGAGGDWIGIRTTTYSTWPARFGLDVCQGGVRSSTTVTAQLDTTYYLSIRRDRYSQVYMDIYSSAALREAGGDGDVGHRSREMVSRIPFKYLYAASSFNSGHALPQTAWAENFQIKHYRNFWLSAAGDYGINPFTYDLTGLSSRTAYFVRAFFHNANGWYYGDEESFGTRTVQGHFTGVHRANHQWGLFAGTNPSMVHFNGVAHRRTIIGYQTPAFLRNGIVSDHLGEGHHCYISVYDWDDARWYGPFFVGYNLVDGDGHSGAALFIDENDRLHVFWGSHSLLPAGLGGGQLWTRSTRTLDDAIPFTRVGDFEEAKTFGTMITYPQVVGVIGGDLIIQARGDTDGEQGAWYESNNYSGAWGAATMALRLEFIDSGVANQICYPTYLPVIDGSGDVHIAWGWRDGFAGAKYNICYAKYNVALDRYEMSDGTPYVLPISIATAEVVSANAHDSAQKLAVDETNRPYIVGVTNDLYVLEAGVWVARTTPYSVWGGIHVVSSSLMYAYCRRTVGADQLLVRFTSTDRGVTWDDGIVLGTWNNEIRPLAFAPAVGNIPTTVALTEHNYTRPQPAADASEYPYTVGNLWMTGGNVREIREWDGADWSPPPMTRYWNGGAWAEPLAIYRWKSPYWWPIWQTLY